MASETELLNSSGLVIMLRDPNTGEVLHLNFPPGITEIPLEAHFPARLAKVTLKAHKIPNGGEYDVRLHFDSAPPKHPTDTREVLVQNSVKESAPPLPPPPPPPPPPPANSTPPVTSVIAPYTPEVTPVASLQMEPFVSPQEAPQEAPEGQDIPKVPATPASPQEAPKETPKVSVKETPKVSGAGGRKGL